MSKPKRSKTNPPRLEDRHRLLGFARPGSFDKEWSGLGLDDDLRVLELMILDHP